MDLSCFIRCVSAGVLLFAYGAVFSAPLESIMVSFCRGAAIGIVSQVLKCVVGAVPACRVESAVAPVGTGKMTKIKLRGDPPIVARGVLQCIELRISRVHKPFNPNTFLVSCAVTVPEY